MPPKTKGVKGYFRQKKSKNTGISKPKASKKSLPSKDGGSIDPEDNHNVEEDTLRKFDMNMAYGPCVGISRIERWERADKLGMNPPKDVELLLRAGKVKPNPLWYGRI